MLITVQRDMYDAVTLKVLVPSTWDDADGATSFLSEGKAVRALSSDDLDKNTKAGRENWRALTKRDQERILGLVALKNALEAKDHLAAEKAATKLKLAGINDFASEVRIQKFVSVEEYSKGRLPVLGLLSTQERLSMIVSRGLRNARFVLWWNGKQFIPALYCENISSALFVQAMLKFLGGGGLAVCPHCGEPFVRTRSDMDYCSVAHREAHRVARFRARQKTLDKHAPKESVKANGRERRNRQ